MNHVSGNLRADRPYARRAIAALLVASCGCGLSACEPRVDHTPRVFDAGPSAPVAADGSSAPVGARDPTGQSAPSAPRAPIDAAAALDRDAAAATTAEAAPPASPASSAQTSDAGASDGAAVEVLPADTEVQARIVGHAASGALCPSDSTSWLLEPGAASFTVQLGAELNASASDVAAPRTGACTLTLDLELPAGLRLGNPDIVLMPVVLGTAELSTRYRFVGGDELAEHTRTLSDDSSFSERGSTFWSAPCADARTPQRVQLLVELRATVPVGSYLGALSLASSFSYEGGSEFRTCDGELLTPEPAGPDGRCATYPSYPCAPDLVCDLLDDRTDTARTLREGTCVDPRSTLAAQPLDAACGGARNVACEAGLVCHYSSAERAAQRPVGICAKASPALDERCGGSPLLACADGLYCGTLSRASDARYCQEGGGQAGARCGEGLAPCADGLTCNGEVCTPKLAERGGRCGQGIAACGHLDVCSERTGRCVENPSAGTLGTRCISDDECDRGLSCLQAECRPRSTGEPGSACEVPNDCMPGLTCRSSVCAL